MGHYIIMKKKMKRMVYNEWVCFGAALLLAWVIMVFLLLLLAGAAYWVSLPEGVISVSILAIYFVGNLAGGFVSGMGVFGKHYLAGMISGVADFVLLLLISLLVNHTLRDFGGNFFTTLAIFIGSGAIGGMFAGAKKKKL